MTIARWSEPDLIDGVVQHRFVVELGQDHRVPAVAWYASTPDGQGARPMVLLGHGGRLHKLGARNVRLAHRLVREHGINSVAIDGPFHGDRSPTVVFDYQAAMVEAGVENVVDQVTSEWRQTLDIIGEIAPFGVTNVGYLGLSMGARFGLSLIASMNQRVSAAVLGKFGLRDSGVLHPGLNTEESTLRAARGSPFRFCSISSGRTRSSLAKRSSPSLKPSPARTRPCTRATADTDRTDPRMSRCGSSTSPAISRRKRHDTVGVPD